MAIIDFITNKLGEIIYPKTKTKAVYLDDDTLLNNVGIMVDETDTEVENVIPRDADTLGGRLPSYFAKQSDMNNLIITETKEITTASNGVSTEFYYKEGYSVANVYFKNSTENGIVMPYSYYVNNQHRWYLKCVSYFDLNPMIISNAEIIINWIKEN